LIGNLQNLKIIIELLETFIWNAKNFVPLGCGLGKCWSGEEGEGDREKEQKI